MVTTRKSLGSSALQPLNRNVQEVPSTPGKQVRSLKAELEKKDDTIAQLTSALTGLNFAKAKIDVSNGIETTNKKGKKDKDAPVPNKTAYKFFCENAPKKECADMRLAWKGTAPEIRQVFINMAEADKARFQRENAVYEEEKIALKLYKEKKKEDLAMEFYEAHLNAQAALEKAEADKKSKKKAKKDPEAPKRPVSSYMYFTMDKRGSVTKEYSGASPTQITKILGDMWNKLEKGKKGKYDDLAAVDKSRYETEKAKYDALIAERKAQTEQEALEYLKQEKEEAMHLMRTFRDASTAVTNEVINQVPNLDGMPVVSDITSNSKNKQKDPNAPKRPMSAYLFFCNENRTTIKSKMPQPSTNKELLIEVGRQWKSLSDKEKGKYNKMASLDKTRYEKEMKIYNVGK